MKIRYLLGAGLLFVACMFLPGTASAGCVVETSGTYAEGANIRDDKCDGGANKKITVSTLLSGEDQTNNVIRHSNDPCSYLKKTTLPISQAASAQLITGTMLKRVFVCSALFTQASASTQRFSLVSGTGTVCATSIGAVIGSTTAGNGMALTFSHGNGMGTIAQTDTDEENVCLLQSTTDRLAGVLTYVVETE